MATKHGHHQRFESALKYLASVSLVKMRARGAVSALLTTAKKALLVDIAKSALAKTHSLNMGVLCENFDFWLRVHRDEDGHGNLNLPMPLR